MARYTAQVSGLVEARAKDALTALADAASVSFGDALRTVIDYGLGPAAEHYARAAEIAELAPQAPVTEVVNIETIRAARRG
jgi:hypothetical protein